MNGVEPSGPRAFNRSADAAMSGRRSPARIAVTIATAIGLGGGKSASLARASGHGAPCSIHVVSVAICSGFSGPDGGIGGP